MATAYLNQTIEIPNIVFQKITREILGKKTPTAGGKLRMDIGNNTIPVKRTWVLECRAVSAEKYNEIVGYLNGIFWCETDFYLDEFGGTPATKSIKAFIEMNDDSRAPFQGESGWDSQGRNLQLTVIEQ
jgi:hypothetical protein